MQEPRSPGRPVEVDPDRIALIALRLFAERGIDDVTMTEVAEAAGIGRRTLFRWFPSKAALVWGGTVEANERFDAAWLAAEGVAAGVVPQTGARSGAGSGSGSGSESSGEGSGALLARVRAAYAASIAPLGETADVTRLRLRLIDDNPTVHAWGHELRERMGERMSAHVSELLGEPADSLRVASLVAAVSAASYAALVWWARNDAGSTPARVLDAALADLAGAFE